MLKTIRSYFWKFKRYQKPLETYLFPVILLLYPFIGVRQGLNIADTTYSLANYRYLDSLDPMWALSTFLANAVGSLVMKLPFAGTMLGMQIYCTLFICIPALAAYYLLQEWMPGWMIFIGAFLAESLCWCPRVILYNTLTYLFLTLGVLFLLKGMFDWENSTIFLALAGVCLGLNFMVRFPNIVEVALILVLWFYQAVTRADFLESVKKTFICIGGFLAGVIVPWLAIAIIYGPSAYFDMIGSLFGMTGGASDYTAGGMLGSIIEAYLHTASDMLIMVPCMVAGAIMFLMLSEKYVLIKKLLYVMGLLVLVRYYFATGTFTRNYQYYDSVFQAVMMFVIVTLILSVVGSIGVLNGSKQEQTLAFAALMIILITPLGSNNYTYPVLNNLFVVAPIGLWLFRRLMQRLGDAHWNFAWQSMFTMILAVSLIQGAIFHSFFAFGDGTDGSKRIASSKVPKVSAMVTTPDNAEAIDVLYDVIHENNLEDTKTIFFGNVPGLSYILDLKPAIDTVWPDLDSYTTEKFDDQLMSISTTSESTPTVILAKEIPEYANASAKYDILMDYIVNHDYNIIFEDEKYMVFAGAQDQ